MKYFTGKTIAYTVITAACIVLFLLTGKTAALVVGVALICYAVFAVFCTFVCGRKIKMELAVKGEQKKGEEGCAVLRIINGSHLPAACLKIEVTAMNRLTGTSAGQTFLTGAGLLRVKEMEIEIRDRNCGMLELKTKRAVVCDPLGIFSRLSETGLPSARVLILPELSGETIDPETLWHYDMESYRFAEGRVGNDTSETVGIREYLPGDNVRLIHWKLSAKTGTVQVREPGLPVDNRLMLIADRAYPENGTDPAGISTIAEYFLSVSLALAEKGLSHTAGWYDSGRREYITEHVTSGDDVFRMMPDFLAAPFSEDSMDACEHFIAADTEKNYAGYMIVTPAEENIKSGAEKLRQYGHLTVLTPDQKE